MPKKVVVFYVFDQIFYRFADFGLVSPPWFGYTLA